MLHSTLVTLEIHASRYPRGFRVSFTTVCIAWRVCCGTMYTLIFCIVSDELFTHIARLFPLAIASFVCFIWRQWIYIGYLRSTSFTQIGLEINIAEAKLMVVNKASVDQVNLVLNGIDIERVRCFQYLECWINNVEVDQEIKTRIEQAEVTFFKREIILSNYIFDWFSRSV